MKIKHIDFRNDFHGTVSTVTATQVGLNGTWKIGPNQSRRIQRELCGIDSCLCSGTIGYRGPQDWDEAELQSDGTILVWISK